MSFIDLDIDASGLNRLQDELQATDKEVYRVLKQALRKTAKKLASKAAKELGPSLGVQNRAIRKRIKAFKLTRRGDSLEVKVWFGFDPLDYADLNPKQIGDGVEAGTKGKLKVRSGFLAPVPNGSLKVFKREGRKRRMTKGRYKGQLRQPIKKQTVAIQDEADKWVESRLFTDRELSDFFMKTFEQDLKWQTQKRK